MTQVFALTLDQKMYFLIPLQTFNFFMFVYVLYLHNIQHYSPYIL